MAECSLVSSLGYRTLDSKLQAEDWSPGR